MTAKELIVELQEILANRFNEDLVVMLDPDFTKDISSLLCDPCGRL